MKLKKKLRKAGVSKSIKLIKVYSFDSSKTPEKWLKYFKKQFEAPTYVCTLVDNSHIVVADYGTFSTGQVASILSKVAVDR